MPSRVYYASIERQSGSFLRKLPLLQGEVWFLEHLADIEGAWRAITEETVALKSVKEASMPSAGRKSTTGQR